MLELQISERERVGKHSLKKLREEGFIPAVIYGKKEKTTSIKLSLRDFKKAFKTAGESAIISLKGLKEDKEVLIHDIDFDPVLDEPRHVDFYAIEKGKKLTVKVPFEFIGVAPAVKELGGILIKVLHELEIEVLPKDLPYNIEVDISVVKDFETSIQVKNLKLPEGVIAITDANEVIVSASEAVEEVVEEIVQPDLEAIEVEERGKDEDDAISEGEKVDEKQEASEEKKENKKK